MRRFPWTLTLLPVLFLIGIAGTTIAIVAVLILLSEALGRSLTIGGERIWSDGLTVFSMLISLYALSAGIFGSLVPGTFAIFLISITAALAWVTRQKQQCTQPPSPLPGTSRTAGFALLYCTTLTLLGWRSLLFFALGLAIFVLAQRASHSRLLSRVASLAIPVGFLASYKALQSSSGQLWLSFDQLYRSALAAGLAHWGIDDHIGATGTPVRYHWLGESVGGILARLSSTTAIEGVTRLVPALGTLLSLTALHHLGRQFSLSRSIVSVSAVITIVLGQIFEVYSTGSLWGISLFLVGTTSLFALRSAGQGEARGFWRAWIAVLVVTPLISMSQSTLGLHFVVFTAITAGLTWIQHRRRPGMLALLVSGQLIVLGVLRATLLSATERHFYQPEFSIRNLMQFRGIELYAGFRLPYVVATSLLFLFVISQLLAGLHLVNRKNEGDRELLLLLLAAAASSLILANLLSIGAQEAQQARFFVPLITLGTFFSIAISGREIRRIWLSRLHSLRLWGLAIATSSALGFLSLLAKYSALDLPWSQRRTFAVGTAVVGSQVVLLLLVTAGRRRRNGLLPSLFLPALLLTTTLTADGRQIRELIGLHRLPVSASRAELITGGTAAEECLEYVKSKTQRDEVIASNWQRIPLALRDSKYFLVSATTERRTYVDGPNFVGYPREGRLPSWLEDRVKVVDGFAERVEPGSFSQLRSTDVRYFIVDARESPARNWEPYADIVLKNEACYVLKLRT